MRKLKQVILTVKWQRQIRAAVSTQLSLLENPSVFALGGLTEEEEQFVRSLVRACERAKVTGRACGPIVEFGTLFGLTTRLIAAEACAGQRVLTVDNFCWNPFGLPPSLHEAFTRRILRGELAGGRVELCVCDSETFRAKYRDAVPVMVFLDADHSFASVRDEIAWAKKLGVPLICGHDYGNQQFDVTRAVDEAFPEGVDVRGMVWSNRVEATT